MINVSSLNMAQAEVPAGWRKPSDSPLKILMVTARYLPYMGGTEMHVYEVGRRLAAENNVTVLTTNPTGKLPAHEHADGLDIVRVRAWPADKDYYFAPGLRHIIANGDWDVIHCQGYHTLVAPLAMASAWQAGIPYVVTFHSGGHSSQARNAGRGVQYQLLRPLLAHAAQLVGVSKFEADFFSERLHIPRDRFTVIQNGARLPEAVDVAPTPPEEPLIVSVGRLEKYKGHHNVILAFAELIKRLPKARLRIAGTGPYEAPLRQMVQDLGLTDSVEIGSVPPSDRQGMATLLARATLVVLLSEYEAHPVSVMEALSLHRPVLVTDTSGLRELADRGLVRSIPLNSSPSMVADAIIKQLDDPLMPSSIELPSWEACATDLLTVYRKVAANHARSTAKPMAEPLADLKQNA